MLSVRTKCTMPISSGEIALDQDITEAMFCDKVSLFVCEFIT